MRWPLRVEGEGVEALVGRPEEFFERRALGGGFLIELLRDIVLADGAGERGERFDSGDADAGLVELAGEGHQRRSACGRLVAGLRTQRAAFDPAVAGVNVFCDRPLGEYVDFRY